MNPTKTRKARRPSADFQFENHGSIGLVYPLNDDARQHLEDHVSPEAQWHGWGLVVEPRYITGLADGLSVEGFQLAVR